VSHRPGDRHRHRAGAAALVVAALAIGALAGCGGGGGASTTSQTTTSGGAAGTTTSAQGKTTSTSSSSPFGQVAAKGHTVSDVLDAVLTSGDPDKACGTGYVTEHYLSTAYGGKQGCVQAQKPGSAAQSLDVQGLAGGSGQAGTAAVKVLAHGGVYDGEKLTVSLVKEGQDWKIDSLKSNAPVGP
jgi:hypothetical protein